MDRLDEIAKPHLCKSDIREEGRTESLVEEYVSLEVASKDDTCPRQTAPSTVLAVIWSRGCLLHLRI